MEKDLIDAISYVQMSEYRQKILLDLQDTLKIPSLIAKSTGIRINHVSRTLKELKDTKLVIVLNPEKKHGKLYKITSLGEEVLKYIE
ncbi:MAG: MarR family transcriptional regulator [Methanobacteriaceae archaeon]